MSTGIKYVSCLWGVESQFANGTGLPYNSSQTQSDIGKKNLQDEHLVQLHGSQEKNNSYNCYLHSDSPRGTRGRSSSSTRPVRSEIEAGLLREQGQKLEISRDSGDCSFSFWGMPGSAPGATARGCWIVKFQRMGWRSIWIWHKTVSWQSMWRDSEEFLS